MRKSTLIFLLTFLAGFRLIAGSGSGLELKDNGYSQKKFSKAPKKVYIAQFRINYQVLFDYTEVAEGGSQIGGGVRGDARARLALGIKGVTEDDLKKSTDQLYQGFIGKLKAAGYDIVSPDEAGKAPTYEGFERKTGGTLSKVQYPGYIMSVPDGFEYYIKGTTGKGKEKSTFVDNSPKLSADLGGAIVVRVNLLFPFVSDGESQGSKMLSKVSGGIAKVVMKTDFRLSNELVAAGTFSTDFGTSQVNYSYASRKIAPDAVSNFVLKDPLPIPGVFEGKKYKAVETANYDFQGSNYGLFRVFSAEDSYFEKMQAVPCEAEKYRSGIVEAGTMFLESTLNELLANSK